MKVVAAGFSAALRSRAVLLKRNSQSTSESPENSSQSRKHIWYRVCQKAGSERALLRLNRGYLKMFAGCSQGCKGRNACHLDDHMEDRRTESCAAGLPFLRLGLWFCMIRVDRTAKGAERKSPRQFWRTRYYHYGGCRGLSSPQKGVPIEFRVVLLQIRLYKNPNMTVAL